jgi:hypothetical protein
MYYAALSEHSIDRISNALQRHATDSRAGRFYPTPADILEKLRSPQINANDVIAAARVAKTPLGVLARMRIGTHDLNCSSSYALTQRANEIVQCIDELIKKSLSGDFTQSEINAMARYDVSPLDPLFPGFPEPAHKNNLACRETKFITSDIYNDKKRERVVDKDKLAVGRDKINQLMKKMTVKRLT